MGVLAYRSYKLSSSGNYIVPLLPNKERSLEYVSTFPFSPEPEVFGLHENADISKNNNETNSVIFGQSTPCTSRNTHQLSTIAACVQRPPNSNGVVGIC